MDKTTRKNSFGQWFSPINIQLVEENVKSMKLDYYKKINDRVISEITTFFTATRSRKFTRINRFSIRRSASEGNRPWFYQCFSAFASVKWYQSRSISTDIS